MEYALGENKKKKVTVELKKSEGHRNFLGRAIL